MQRLPQALAGVRVVEIAQGVAGPLCARYLADFGATILKVEPPEGDAARAWEGGWAFENLNRNKDGLTVDLADRATLDGLLDGWADCLVLDETVAFRSDFSPAELHRRFPRLVVVAITPFGLSGPNSGAPGSDLTALAAGGFLGLTGDRDREPVQLPGMIALHVSGVAAAVAALLALRWQRATGQGQIVDVSHQDVIASLLEQALVEHSYAGNLVRRNGIRHLIAHGMGRPRLKDGTFVFAGNLPEARMWSAVVDFLGVDELRDPALADLRARLPQADRIDAAVQAAIGDRTLDEVFLPLQSRGVPLTPLATTRDVRESPQLAAREFFVHVETPAGATELLGPAVKLPATPGRIRRPAPALGERTIPQLSAKPASPPGPAPRSILDGIRVLDLTWVWSGPMLTQLLASFGADVIKVESRGRPDLGRVLGPFPAEPDLDSSGFFHLYNRGKRSIGVNLRNPDGIRLAQDLAANADVVIENFSAGKIDDLGLGYSTLRRRNPRLVLLSLPGMGLSGPRKQLVLYGQNVEALAGLMFATGYPDRPPGKGGVIYCDPIAAYTGAFALLAALQHAGATGEGQHVDLSMLEATVSLTSLLLNGLMERGEIAGRRGNRSAVYAPQGVYPGCEPDRWLALTVLDDASWQQFCAAIGAPDLAAAFSTLGERRSHADAIEEAIRRWASVRPVDEAVAVCRAAGVAASPVLDPPGVFADPHLVGRGFFVRSEEAGAGIQPLPGPLRFSGRPAFVARPAPRLGEHTDEVLRDLLTLDDATIAGLRAAGVVE